MYRNCNIRLSQPLQKLSTSFITGRNASGFTTSPLALIQVSHFNDLGPVRPTFANSQSATAFSRSLRISGISANSVTTELQWLSSVGRHWISLIESSLSNTFTSPNFVNVVTEIFSKIKATPDTEKVEFISRSNDSVNDSSTLKDATTTKKSTTSAAASAATGGSGNEAGAPTPEKKKKEKKIKKPQPAKIEVPITPGLVDIRVGHIVKAIKHPDADSLYVSTIDMGDETGPRTVCSGLVNHIPLEAMQDRLVVVIANLKPVKMRGIKSAAMVFCASNDTSVEFVNPPAGSQPGDRLFFETFDSAVPEPVLSPKRKVWETLQPGFFTNEQLEVVFKKDGDPERRLVNKDGKQCSVSSLANAPVR